MVQSELWAREHPKGHQDDWLVISLFILFGLAVCTRLSGTLTRLLSHDFVHLSSLPPVIPHPSGVHGYALLFCDGGETLGHLQLAVFGAEGGHRLLGAVTEVTLTAGLRGVARVGFAGHGFLPNTVCPLRQANGERPT